MACKSLFTMNFVAACAFLCGRGTDLLFKFALIWHSGARLAIDVHVLDRETRAR
jgi:hypothetical protein